MNKQRARTDSDKQRRRDKILESAKKLFSTHGYQETTIKMITEEASLSPGSFYLYFASKIEVYRTLNITGIDLLESMITEAISADHRGSADKIRALARGYYRFFSEERELYNIIAVNHLGLREFFLNQRMVPVLEDRTKNLLAILESVITEGIASGEFREVDPWMTAAALWGMIDGELILEVKRSTEFIGVEAPELVDHITELVLQGLVIG